jgi:hypothetical protein
MKGESMNSFTIEIFYKGDPQYLVDIKDLNEDSAIRRAISAVWMKALRDGREWNKDDITGRVYLF